MVCMYNNCKVQGTNLEGIHFLVDQLTLQRSLITISEDVGSTCIVHACESTADNFTLICLGVMGKEAD